jgi:alkylation response protein AidB-like acyl-CoA dehydrogenase
MESESGSDIRAIRTVAKLLGDAYVVSGEKSMITFAEAAQGFVVLAQTDMGSRESITCFFIELTAQGLTSRDFRGLAGGQQVGKYRFS